MPLVSNEFKGIRWPKPSCIFKDLLFDLVYHTLCVRFLFSMAMDMSPHLAAMDVVLIVLTAHIHNLFLETMQDLCVHSRSMNVIRAGEGPRTL